VHHWVTRRSRSSPFSSSVCTNGVFGPQRPLHTGARPNQTAPDVLATPDYGRDAQRRVAPAVLVDGVLLGAYDPARHVMLAAPRCTSPALRRFLSPSRCPWRRVDDSCDGCSFGRGAHYYEGSARWCFHALRHRLLQRVMVVWMIPRVFNPAMVIQPPRRPDADQLLRLGLLFWMQFIPSRPWRPTLSPSHGWAPCSSRTS